MLFDGKFIHIVLFADDLVCVAVKSRRSVDQLTDHERFGQTVSELTVNSQRYNFPIYWHAY